MELRHLRYLIAVAEEHSFVAAAARLQLAQPSLSRQIRDLERELEAELFVRESSGARPTPVGDACVRAAREILDHVRAAIQRARLAEHGLVGRCIVGAGRYPLWNGLLARVVAQARVDYPAIELVIEEYTVEAQARALASAEVDIAFGPAPAAEPMQFVVETHSVDVIDAVMLAKTHPLAARASVSVADLAKETWLRTAPDDEDEGARSFQSLLEQQGLASTPTRVASNADSLSVLVRSGAGWCLLPRSMGRALGEGLVAIPLDGAAVPLRYVSMHRRGDARSVVRSILRSIRRAARGERIIDARAEPPSGIRELPEGPQYASRIELRHFRYFAAIAENESIGAAADALDLTQPALSRQLRDFEAELGVDLFYRTARGVAQTLAGERLYADAVAILRAADGLAAEAQRVLRGSAGDCVVGMVSTPFIWRMVTHATPACAAHPAIDVRLEDVPTPRQPAALRDARIDVAIGHRYPTASDVDPSVVRELLVPDTLNMALVSVNHPLAARREVALNELGSLPLLFIKRAFSPAFHDYVMSTFARAGYVPRIEGAYDGLSTVWTLAAQGLGWCLTGASQRADPPRGVMAIPIVDLDIPWGFELAYRRDEARPPVLQFIAAIRQAAQALHESMPSPKNRHW